MNNINVSNAYGVYDTYKTNKTKASSRAAQNKDAKDSVSFSAEAKDFQLIKEALQKTPDVRESKVTQLKTLIDSNQYHVKSEEIAKKMLHLFNN